MTFFANNCFRLIWVLLASSVWAQAPTFELNSMPPPRVTLHYTPSTPQIGDSLVVSVGIVPGWHVNAHVVADDFLLPSRLDVGAKGMAFGNPVWPTPVKEYSEALQIQNLIFKDTFEIKVPVIQLEKDADASTTHVVFHYQACSNFICLAPAKVTASLRQEPLPVTPLPSVEPAKKKELAVLDFFKLLGLAFLGGLILNLMPCVLPVLSLKVFSLIRQSRHSRIQLLKHGLATTSGILFSFWVLAAAILLVRSAGGITGWGFQFQHTGFIVFMMAVLTLFTANLLGAFEIWLPGKAMTRMDHFAHKEGLTGAFFQGALLTLLSTPCSAPFLGTAMGFAFGASGLVLFYFFGAAALGLATPYFLMSAFPQLVRWLPKPGPWMLRFKQFLAFPMLATVIWLGWVLGQQAGASSMTWVLAWLCVLALFAWVAGWVAPPGQPFWRVLLVWGAALLLLVPLWYHVVSPQIVQGKSQKIEALKTVPLGEWEPYSAKRLAELRQNQKTVFIDFTADWCITCKANEKAVLARDTVKRTFRDLEVVLLKADWTTQNPEVSQLLAKYGRSGVPFYLVFPANDHDHPIALPELLTLDAVLTALEKAGPSL